jgi:hypothetical protein
VRQVACDNENYPAAAKTLPPITVTHNGETRSIHLPDVYEHNGSVCTGATLAFRAVRHGLDTLYGEQVPDLDDLVVISLAPGGPMDLLDMIIRGDGAGDRTWPPPGIAGGVDKFVFQFMRKSTMQMVTVRLKDGSGRRTGSSCGRNRRPAQSAKRRVPSASRTARTCWKTSPVWMLPNCSVKRW